MPVLEYAIGDLHGRSDLFDAALDAIEHHAGENLATIILLGDYVDRGPDSRGVIERAMAGPRRPGDVMLTLMGNHEEMLLDAVAGEPGATGEWVYNGGDATLASFGGRDRADLSVIPEAHLAWIRGLALAHQTEHRLYVHAGVNPDRALDDQSPDDLLWIREPFLRSRKDFGLHVVHGHTITDEVALRPNRTGLDIGAYYSGRLAIACSVPRFRAGHQRFSSSIQPSEQDDGQAPVALPLRSGRLAPDHRR